MTKLEALSALVHVSALKAQGRASRLAVSRAEMSAAWAGATAAEIDSAARGIGTDKEVKAAREGLGV